MPDEPKPAPHPASSPIDQMKKMQETLVFLERVAMLAVHRLGGTMRIKDEEWLSAEGGNINWRTVRMPGLEPELHIACTLLGETLDPSAVRAALDEHKPN